MFREAFSNLKILFEAVAPMFLKIFLDLEKSFQTLNSENIKKKKV